MNRPSPFSCRRAERLISRALDVPLSGKESARLEAHLSACAGCRARTAAFASLAEGLTAARESVDAALSVGGAAGGALAEHALARHRAAGTAINGRRGHSAVPAALAAAGLAASVAALAFVYRPGDPTAPVAAPSVTAVVASPAPSTSPASAVAVPQPRPSSVGRSVAPLAAASSLAGPRYTGMTLPRRAGDLLAPRHTTAPEHGLPAAGARRERAAAAVAPVLSGTSDDMAFLNPAPGAFARRWARLTASEADALERRLRDSVRGGDDFVEVPLPRLASMNRRVAAEAVQSYKKQREIVDARLQRNVALAAKGQSFADLCAQLSKETGVQIEAARSVADDKVTVFCKARPAREVMRAVTELFDFYWERFGEEGNYRYRLIQPLRSQLLEEELRNRDRNEALLALDRQMEKVKALLDLSPGDAQERLKSATTDEEKKLLGLLAGPQAGSARLYFGLGQEELGALRAGQELKFSTDPALAALTLPAELRYPTLKGVEQKETAFLEPTTGTNFKMHRRMGEEKAPTPPPGSVPLSQWPSAIPFVALKLDASNLGQVRLMGSGGYRVEGKSVGPDGKEDVNSFTSIYGQPLAVGASPSAEDPKNAEANASLTSDPALGEPVKLPAAPAGALATKPAGQKWITSADIAEAFHRATGRDVVADHYTRLFEPSLLGTGDAAGGKLFDVLSRVSDKARLRWGYADAWLSFRSASFFNDRPKEIPNRLLDRWVAARKANDDRLPFDVMLEAVQLSDAQLDGEEMARGVRELYGIAEWDTLRATNMRQGWRFLAALPKNLRAAALSEKGLAFEQLPLGQQQQFGTLTFGSDTPGVTVGDLAGATLRVELPGGPDEKDKDQPWVRMTYLYGGERTGRTKKVQTPGSSSVSNDGPDAAKNLKPDAPLKG